MINYDKYEVQSSDCYNCKCKDCSKNDICKNGCNLCIRKGVTEKELNKSKECY